MYDQFVVVVDDDALLCKFKQEKKTHLDTVGITNTNKPSFWTIFIIAHIWPCIAFKINCSILRGLSNDMCVSSCIDDGYSYACIVLLPIRTG